MKTNGKLLNKKGKEEMIDRKLTGFSLYQTSVAKGFACLLLLFHHLFYNKPECYERFTSVFKFGGGTT